jgi:hypothetical protein
MDLFPRHTLAQQQKVATPTFTSVHGSVLQRQCACGQHASAGGECEECKQKREGTLQRAAINLSPVHEVPPIVYEALNSPGRPLDAATRAFMEPCFGHDFSNVQIRSVASRTPQSKLAVSQPGDAYEQEADRLAEAVMRMPDQTTRESAGSWPLGTSYIPWMSLGREARIQRQPLDETTRQPVVDTAALFSLQELKQDEEEEARARQQMIMTKRIGAGIPFPVSASLSAHLANSKTGGAPLTAETQQFMEPRFGVAFAHVRVHNDERAAAMCANLGAKAFTYGHNIYFGNGWYSPGTKDGKKLLAHELTHVQQQSRDASQVSQLENPVIQRACQDFPAYASPDTYCETEAEARASISHACPPYRDDFLYRDGPTTHPWRRIPGYGCAHHVAHILGIRNGATYQKCRGGFSVTIDQVTQNRAAHPLAEAQVNDVWSSGIHSGVVRQVDATANPPRVRVDQCGVGGNAQNIWMNYGNVYR